MNPLDFVERLFSSIGSIFSRIGSLYAQGADTAKKPWLRRIVVTLVLLVVVAGLAFLALALLPLLPMRFWQVLGLCVVALVVLWWFMAGQRKASLKGRTRKRTDAAITYLRYSNTPDHDEQTDLAGGPGGRRGLGGGAGGVAGGLLTL